MSEPTGASGVALNASDLKILAAAFKHSQNPIKPDYKSMATELGYSNVNSACNAWHKVSKKILGADIGASPRKAVTPKKTPTKNGRQGDDMESPSKRHKATKSRYITLDDSDEQQEDDDDDDDEVATGAGRVQKGDNVGEWVKQEAVDEV